MNKVFTLTLNSAIEEVIFAESYEASELKNVKDRKKYTTGKAVNTGIVLSNMHVICDINVVCGEDTELEYRNLANAYRNITTFPVQGRTRTNQTIVLPNGKEYKLINKGYSLSKKQTSLVYNDIVNKVGKDDLLLIAGSLPDGVPNEWYGSLINKTKKKGVKVFFDAANDALLDGMNNSPYYIKPNEEELLWLLGKNKISEIHSTIKKISTKYGIENVVVTLGPQGALGYNTAVDRTFKVFSEESFPLDAMTTGCGDSFNAGFIYGVINGANFIQSMKYGVAFGSANIFSGFPEKIQQSNVDERMKYVSCEAV